VLLLPIALSQLVMKGFTKLGLCSGHSMFLLAAPPQQSWRLLQK
jgi:hypothetical protein